MKAQPLNIAAMREELSYNPETGAVASITGKGRETTTPLGYKRIFWRGRFYRCHRVAWALHYNEQPPQVIDHVNGDGTDNRITNLRAASFSQNKQNSRVYKNNKSGVHGVYWLSQHNKWTAVISCGGRTRSLGRFKTFEEARQARRNGELSTFGEFAPQHQISAAGTRGR